MKTKIYENEKNYVAIVVTIQNLRDLEGLDNLRASSIFGTQVLLGKEVKIGDKGVYFPAECQLSEEFTRRNNLFRHTDKNNDPNAKAGFVEDSRRVKAIKLRGHQSGAFWIPVDSLNYITEGKDLDEGLEFNELDGVHVCSKYFSKRNKVSANSNPKKKNQIRLVDLVDVRVFPEHYDTSHLFRNIHRLSLEDRISATLKIHGTSLRVGRTIVYRQLSWFEKFLQNWLKIPIDDKTYRYVVGSRRAIKSIDFNGLDGKQHFYGESDIYTEASRIFRDKLHKGERIYAEIIGWTDSNTPIQKGYSYGLPEGTHKVYVYRISNTNEDGVAQDLSWGSLKERCQELDVEHVPELFYGKLKDFGKLPELIKYNLENYGSVSDLSWQVDLEEYIKSELLEKPSMFTTKTWSAVEEGVVLAKEKLGITEAYKAKAFSFLQHESKMYDAGEDNIEDQQEEFEASEVETAV